jgi:hypothetical protein
MIARGISIVPLGTRWPTGDLDIAVLNITPDQLANTLGCELHAGVEEGLGPWQGIGIRAPSGRDIEFVHYDSAPKPNGTIVRIDKADDPIAALLEAIAVLNLDETAIQWRRHEA